MRTWHAAGSYFEACNCEAICPCRSVGGRPGSRASYDRCEFALSWQVLDGQFADVPLAGLAVVLAGWYAEDEPDSPWRIVLYVDKRGEREQQDALADIFLGRAGGTPALNYGGAIGTVHRVRPAAIELDHRPRHWRIADESRVLVTGAETVSSDETIGCGIPGQDHPGEEIRTKLLRVDDEPLSWEVRDRTGFATDFAYEAG